MTSNITVSRKYAALVASWGDLVSVLWLIKSSVQVAFYFKFAQVFSRGEGE
jgi:hypothetical protein